MARRRTGQKRYAIYLRCSSEDQVDGEFTTIDAQRAFNQDHVTAHGGILIREYVDEAKTGTNLNRPGFESLLRDAKAGQFDVVVVTYMSRLARGDMYAIAAWQLEQVHVEIELVREHFGSDLAGYIGKQMTVVMDGMYQKMVGQWTKAKQEQMVKLGYFCGGRVPYGYKKVIVQNPAFTPKNDKEPPETLVPDEDQAPHVLRAFELYAQTHSVVKAVAYLNSATDREWNVDDVTYMLRNEVYRGVLQFGQNVNPTGYTPIVSQDLWDAVRAVEENGARSPKVNMKDPLPYYFRGLVFCEHCGSRMTPAGHHGMNDKIGYYECLGAKKKGTCTCPTYRVNSKALHNAMLDEISRLASHPTRLEAYARAAVERMPEDGELAREIQRLTRTIKDLDKQIKAITRALEESGVALRPLIERMKTLEERRQAVELKLSELEAQRGQRNGARPQVALIQARWKKIVELWDEFTDEERTTAVLTLVKRVDIQSKTEGTCQMLVSGQVPFSYVEPDSIIERGSDSN